MFSCARATRGLGRPSLDTRSGRPIRPPFCEKRTSKLGGIICGRARGTGVLRALLCGMCDWSCRAAPMVVFRQLSRLPQQLDNHSVSPNSHSNRLKSRMSLFFPSQSNRHYMNYLSNGPMTTPSSPCAWFCDILATNRGRS